MSAQLSAAPLPPAPEWHGASESLIVGADHPWITPAEANGFTETPNYAETRAWIERLAAASPMIRIESFGRSPQGRELFVVFATADGEDLDHDKPTLFVQAGIHPGEIDGKDAMFMLLRDIAFGEKRALLDRVNLVFVPIFNVDGHERASPYNRPNQRGPSNQGWRNTAQNLNLNRDYTKLDAPETRAMLALLQSVRPDLYIDVHVTDGMDYQYDITYGFMGRDRSYAASPHIARWLNQHFRPEVDEALDRNGHVPADLIFANNDRDLAEGLAAFTFSPRFSQSYGDMVGMPSVLIENHSLKPYRQRVLGTYVLLEESLRLLARHGGSLRSAVAADARERPRTLPVGWTQTEAPISQRPFLPIEHESYRSTASGAEETRWIGRNAAPTRMPQYGQESTITLQRPRAYWVPATKQDVITVLRLHGIQFETITEARTVNIELLRLPQARAGVAPVEGRTRVTAGEPDRITREEWMPPGSIRVPTDQPLGDLAMILLEPQSEDSFFAWGFFNEILQRVEYLEAYALAPMADEMLANDAALRAEFEAKLATDPAFAADPDARLAWFYARSPYYDTRYQLYPVGIER
ncbi:M14 family metallopeptidase [Terricaulis silvestris]|uniref:Zinc carboxypeptidase n=1 Tax=Terricaulis silvestris TaxID=2686094 RepID=A0A6I6MPN8_9CAUL|nr:M14 family metallopeptidase [Terricaulis silvestris]QGZ96121.1 Zinc carboxypeptidase [Terricaulis silvestris]